MELDHLLLGKVFILVLKEGHRRHLDLLGHDGRAEPFHILVREPQVLDAAREVERVVPLDAEELEHRVGEPKLGTRVAPDEHARDAALARVNRGLLEDLIFLGSKGAVGKGDVIGDDDERASRGALRCE